MRDTHLFDTREECCAEYPCDLGLEALWHPMLDLLGEVMECVNDSFYPLFMIERPEENLFENKEDCLGRMNGVARESSFLLDFGASPLVALGYNSGGGGDGDIRPRWHPDIHGKGNACVYDAAYEAMVAEIAEEYRSNYLFDTMDECCTVHECDG